MKPPPYLLSTALVGALLVGCGQQEQEASSRTSATESATAADTHAHADGSTHAAHGESELSHSHGHSHGGEIVSLGKKQVLGFTVKAALSPSILVARRRAVATATEHSHEGEATAAGVLYPFFGLLLSPMIAAAAMTFSSLSVIGNALRLRRHMFD